jgi:hypothetical protein
MLSLEGRSLSIIYCSHDKRPIGPRGWYSAVADATGIAKLKRGPNVGVPTGAANGIVIVDVDPRNGGDKSLAKYLAWLPTTRTHRTRGGGLHLIFKYPAQGVRNFQGRPGRLPGIDILADGKGVLWPPSPGYSVQHDGPVMDCPDRLRELVAQPRQLAPVSQSTIKQVDASLLAGSNDRLPRDLYLKALRLCPLGQGVTRHDQRRLCGVLRISLRRTALRNEGLFNAAVAMRDLTGAGIIDYSAATELLLDTARLNGYAAKDSERAALATIRSGLTPTSARREASFPSIAEEVAS